MGNEGPAEPVRGDGHEFPTPYSEPLGVTLRRTLTIGFFVATAVTFVVPSEYSYLRLWLITYPAVLWFPLGGHYVELVYLNGLRMHWAWARRHRHFTRVCWWALGGLPLGLGCWWTWVWLGAHPGFRPPLWWGMPFFVAAECVVHGVLSLLGRPSFWNGRE